jgi:hypothetical protein
MSAKLADRAVTRRNLARAAVTSDRLAPSAVRRANIADGAITAKKVSGDLPSAGIANLTYVRLSGSLPPDAAVAATAQCPRGTVPIAGGAELPHKIGVFMLDEPQYHSSMLCSPRRRLWETAGGHARARRTARIAA